MAAYSLGDWLFIAGVMVVIFVCVAFSDLRKKK